MVPYQQYTVILVVIWCVSLFIMLQTRRRMLLRHRNMQRRNMQLPSIHDRLRRLLKDLHDICNSHGIQYWADSGTLLGAVRTGGIIAHDDDVDVCITSKSFLTLRKVLANHASLHIQLASRLGVHKLKSKDDPDVWIDLFEVCDAVICKQSVVRYLKWMHRMTWPKYWYATSELYPLKLVPFDNAEIWIPQSPIPYLERAYGMNWQVPQIWNLHT